MGRGACAKAGKACGEERAGLGSEGAGRGAGLRLCAMGATWAADCYGRARCHTKMASFCCLPQRDDAFCEWHRHGKATPPTRPPP